MKLKKLPIVITICVVLCVLAVVGSGVFFSQEASLANPYSPALENAEFSIDGGVTWQSVGDGSALRRQRGDVAIRGHFDVLIEEGWILNLYLQHVQMELLINGEMVGSFAREFDHIRPEWCADLWVDICMPETKPEDLVEFRLYTLHRFGVNSGVYEKMLSSMSLGDPFFIYQWISAEKAPEQYFGLVLMIIGMVLFVIAFVALWMKSPLQKIMMYTALVAVGEGLFWLAGSSEIAHYANGSIAFFSTGRSVSRMLSIYALLACMAELIRGKAKIAAQAAAYVDGVLSIGFLLLNVTGLVAFCEVEQIWHLLQLLFLLVGLFCCIAEISHARHSFWNTVRLVTYGLAYAALLLDIGNLIFGWYAEMQLSKYVCGAVALGHTAALLVQLPASYKAIQRAEMLSEELHNSRIVLAMSQIRTHFIFNVLNAISGLCKSDPELADTELVRFSRYLRNNIDIMQEDKPIPFEKALDHMHNYVDLERLRFDEKILLDENYEYLDFMIPSLVIQPLVENAIKHGLLPKEEGGVIQVSTHRCGNEVMIVIEDDGVGFDTRKEIAKTSVGLSNVRFRVERMMGGRMHIDSTPGKGTVVRVWLPLREEDVSCTLST